MGINYSTNRPHNGTFGYNETLKIAEIADKLIWHKCKTKDKLNAWCHLKLDINLKKCNSGYDCKYL